MERILKLFEMCTKGDDEVTPELERALKEVKIKKEQEMNNVQQGIGFYGTNLVLEWSEAGLVADLKLIEDMTKLIEDFET